MVGEDILAQIPFVSTWAQWATQDITALAVIVLVPMIITYFAGFKGGSPLS